MRSLFPSGSCLKTKRFATYPCMARRRSGTKILKGRQAWGLFKIEQFFKMT